MKARVHWSSVVAFVLLLPAIPLSGSEVKAGQEGVGAAEVHVNISPPPEGPPIIPPTNLRTQPIDQGFRLSWDASPDAESYEVEVEVAPGFWFAVGSHVPVEAYTFIGLSTGTEIRTRVVPTNSFGRGAASEPLSFVVMRNLALPSAANGITPPSGYVYVASQYEISGMNDGQLEDHNDSGTGQAKSEDFWGYLWPQSLLFDCIAYFTGEIASDGGWFTELTVQYTEDGTTWEKIPNVEITPAYDFTDSAAGREDFARYDIGFETVMGKGIRIYGTPGGSATFTSVAELEVYGDQTQAPPQPKPTITRSENNVSLAWKEFGDGEYTVEMTDDLSNVPWQNPPGTWPITGSSWTDADVMNSPVMQCFYRIESDGVYTAPAGFIKVIVPLEGLGMLSVPLGASDSRLNGEPGCIGDMLKEHLIGGPAAGAADSIWKWDASTQDYVTAFLVEGMGEGYDGQWWDPHTGGLSEMTLGPSEAFWIMRVPAAAQ